MRLRLLIAALITSCSMLLAFSPACAMHAQSSPEQTVRASLDVLADVIDPASQFASQACSAKKEVIVGAVEAHKTSPAAGQTALDTAIERCNLTRMAFDRMRALHADAVRLVNAGDLSQALARLSELRASWRALEDGLPPTVAASDGGGAS